MLNEIKDCSWIIIAGLAIAGLWYCFWVQPNDATMSEIMDCMGDDRSKQSYERCRVLVVGD